MERPPHFTPVSETAHVDAEANWPVVGESFRFDRFEVDPSTRTLLRDGRRVDLGSRTFDLLLLLLRSSGEIVSRDLIVERVWPLASVDESNLRVQIAALRKALGSARDLIKTVSGRGYILVAEVEHVIR